jgi:hypothetical protein
MSGSDDSAEHKITRLAELPRSIEPRRDFWPAIEAKINEMQAAGPKAPGARVIPKRLREARLSWLAAAAMVASVAVGVWIGRSLLPAVGRGAENTVVTNTPAVPAGLPAATEATSLDAAYVSDPRYQRQRAALLRSLPARLAALPPPARDKVLASLATIRKAKQDLESALGKDPGNALLQELLVDTYQDEMRVLTDVREASEPGRGI